jgi:chemotaxis signal transduction protein
MVDVLESTETATRSNPAVDNYCVFRCGETWFSLPALSVREVMSSPKLFPVPHCHASLAGLCHVRNEFLPVVHLQVLLGGEAPKNSRGGQLLIVNTTGVSWAFLIDRAVAIDSLDLSINPDIRLDDGLSAAFLGTATYGEHVVRVLDPNSLYRLAEESLRRGWQSEVTYQ